MTREFIDFVLEHKDDDTARLLFSAARYPDIDVPAAVQQIEGMRTAREKWPSLLQCEAFEYPPRLNREQASSEATAQYKASLLGPLSRKVEKSKSELLLHEDSSTREFVGLKVVDLTGGMGIDSIAFARTGVAVDYVERNPQLCALMERNCKALGLSNVSVHCADSMEWLATNSELITPTSALYIDPARRSETGRKVAAFEDCEPDILKHLPSLRSHWLLVKASPMIDIDLACRQLGNVSEVHIVAVGGECKEVLFLCGSAATETRIVCGNLVNQSIPSTTTFRYFTRAEEAAAVPRFCQTVGRYLYEPDATLMKGGPFNLICHWFTLEKLARNTHLYTSDERVGEFPGRTFEVLCEMKLARKAVAAAIPEGKAHVVVRNYPVEAATLQRQLGLKEGGDLFVVATTIGARHTAFLCRKV